VKHLLISVSAFVLALGLVLVFSEACIPFAHKLLARIVVVHRRGLQSSETTLTAFMVWPPPCTKGNEACGGLARSS
jgi:hypothetical protein